MRFPLLDGYKTYVAAIGLVGLSVYQFSQGQFDQGTQSLLAALAAFGLRHAISNATPEITIEVLKQESPDLRAYDPTTEEK